MIAPIKSEPVLPDLVLEHGLHVLTDEYNECIVGINAECTRVVYDIEKILEVIQQQDKNLTRDDCWKHFSNNIQDCMPREVSPVYIFPIEIKE
jgi:hypothetical protein